jgi:predicted TIM-barrel fold metal-dependent hydrolase
MKISFLGYTDPKWGQNETLMEKVREVIQIFSPKRCMLASNFPVDSLEKYGSWNIETLV